jgi:multicomponent Na+:H+ antiporter subunit D
MIDSAPVLLFYLAAVLAIVLRGWLRSILMLSVPVAAAAMLYSVDPGYSLQVTLMDMHLTPVRIDNLSLLFGYLFCIAAFLGNIYALHSRDTIQLVAAQAYAGSAIGAVLAGDLLTLFIYWEMMALTSSTLIFARRTDVSLKAGMRYLIAQMVSGLLLLAGIMLYYHATGSLAFDHIGLDEHGGWLIFLAFGIKSAFPFMHSWLTDAYPEATPTGTVFLASFTTKVAVYALARSYAGTELLVYIGAVMAFFPIYYAVIENDLRRVLAYSLINQIGFMVVGIGIGTELALNGAVGHAFADVIFKGLLLMSMGAVLHVTGEMRGSELGGLYKRMPKTAILCIIGAASISAFPLFSGFVSKSMVVTAVLDEGHFGVWLILLFAAAGVFHHAGIKIPFFAFFAHDSKYVETAHEPPVNMLIAMALGAMLCLGIGMFPQQFYSMLPWEMNYSPYDVSHVLSQMQLLFFSALAFTWLKLAGIYPPELKSVNIDVEWVYRKLIPRSLVRICHASGKLNAAMKTGFDNFSQSLINRVMGVRADQGLVAATRTIGGMVMWVALLLATSLILYYL